MVPMVPTVEAATSDFLRARELVPRLRAVESPSIYDHPSEAARVEALAVMNKAQAILSPYIRAVPTVTVETLPEGFGKLSRLCHALMKRGEWLHSAWLWRKHEWLCGDGGWSLPPNEPPIVELDPDEEIEPTAHVEGRAGEPA